MVLCFSGAVVRGGDCGCVVDMHWEVMQESEYGTAFLLLSFIPDIKS